MSFHFSINQEFIMKKLFASLALAAAVAPVWAATQTVTLAVPGMTCAACPIRGLTLSGTKTHVKGFWS